MDLLSPRMMIFYFLSLLILGGFLVCLVFFRLIKRKKLLDAFQEKEKEEEHQEINYFVRFFSKVFISNNEEIKNKFISAGFYDFKYASLYMPIKYMVLLIGSALIIWFTKQQEMKTTMIIALSSGWLVIIIILPDALLDRKSKKLTHKVSTQLPYLLDLMAVCVQTGMTIEAAMSYLSKEMAGFDKDLTQVLVKTNDRARIVGLAKALDELYIRVPSNEMRSFVMTLKQSLQYGTSIYTVLTTLAADIRDVQMLELEEKIGKLAAKMSIPLIVFIMVPIVILIAAPGIMRMMVNV